MSVPSESGESGFLAGLHRYGSNPRRIGEVILYEVEAAHGSHAGERITTGVTAAEAAAWPSAPPHWIHLPARIQIPVTNISPSPHPDMVMHSRTAANWGDAVDPAQGWLAHVRSLIGEA